MASVPVLIGLSAMVLGAQAAQNGLVAAEVPLTTGPAVLAAGSGSKTRWPWT